MKNILKIILCGVISSVGLLIFYPFIILAGVLVCVACVLAPVGWAVFLLWRICRDVIRWRQFNST